MRLAAGSAPGGPPGRRLSAMPDSQVQPKHKLRVPRAQRGPFRILLGTRKGAFVMDGDGTGRDFEAPRPAMQPKNPPASGALQCSGDHWYWL